MKHFICLYEFFTIKHSLCNIEKNADLIIMKTLLYDDDDGCIYLI